MTFTLPFFVFLMFVSLYFWQYSTFYITKKNTFNAFLFRRSLHFYFRACFLHDKYMAPFKRKLPYIEMFKDMHLVIPTSDKNIIIIRIKIANPVSWNNLDLYRIWWYVMKSSKCCVGVFFYLLKKFINYDAGKWGGKSVLKSIKSFIKCEVFILLLEWNRLFLKSCSIE